MTWHARPATAVADELQTDPEAGLSDVEATRRLHAHGPNALPSHQTPGALHILARQFRSLLIWILLAAIALSLLLGDTIEAIAIGIITTFTVVLGFVQEHRAERAMDALRHMTAPEASVVRDGKARKIPAEQVVPGDVLVLAPGDVVAADARIITAEELEAAEAALTGESLPVAKHVHAELDDDAALGDRSTMLYAATNVTRGRGRAVVTSTGSQTEVGKIGRMLHEVETADTPLERQLARLGRWLLWAGGAIVVMIVVAGILRGQPWTEMVVFGVALAVAAVPEALPAVVTIGLAIGAQRMVKRNALVRRLPTVETLGATTVICSDKTGTLTTGAMTAHKLVLPSGMAELDAAPQAMLEAAGLCNDATLSDDEAHGDPTEIALLRFAAERLDLAALGQARPRSDEEPFAAESQRMITVHGEVSYAKGSSQAILAMCDHILVDGEARPLDDAGRSQLDALGEEAAGRGMRVLAFAQGTGLTGGFTLLGLIGLRDPPRDEAREAVTVCTSAGIRPVLITGDHPATARAIGSELGFPDGEAITGQQVEAMDDAALGETSRTASIYARVSPAHKLRIVESLQSQGEVVAMTGDGVNDAPALRKADIGVAMGITGTEVSKEAADMLLADDNFATIVAAVEEGRSIFSNIRKYLIYLLSTNLGELLLIAAAVLFGWPLPLSAVMVLYVNLASDGLPALALAVDPPEPGQMARPPRDPRAGILDGPILAIMALGGLWTAAAVLSTFMFTRASHSLPISMTVALATLVLMQFTMGFSFRTEGRWVTQSPFANKWYNLAVLWEIGLLLAVIYTAPLNRLFGTAPLPAATWLPVLVTVASVVPVLELAKWSTRKSRGTSATKPE